MGKIDEEVKEFIDAIGARRDSFDDPMLEAVFRKLFKRQNYFFYEGKFLIIKISHIDNVFYGVKKDIIDFLLSGDIDFFLILLKNRRTGWCYSKRFVKNKISTKQWSLSEKDNNYKINAGNLDELRFFRTVENFKILISTG